MKNPLEGREDVSHQLFSKKYQFYIPYLNTQPAEALEYWGIAGHHNKQELEEIVNEPVLVKATLPYIAELIFVGVEVRLHDKRQANEMFNLIVDHLENWLAIAKAKPRVKLPPLEDLLAFDTLAGCLFKFVDLKKEHIPNSLDVIFGNDILGLSPILNRRQSRGYESYKDEFIQLGAMSSLAMIKGDTYGGQSFDSRFNY